MILWLLKVGALKCLLVVFVPALLPLWRKKATKSEDGAWGSCHSDLRKFLDTLVGFEFLF